jgi:hypothetical protein
MKNKDYHTTGTDCRKRQNRKPVIKTKVHIPSDIGDLIRISLSCLNSGCHALKEF